VTFPAESCESLDVEAIQRDDFLLDVHDLDPKALPSALE